MDRVKKELITYLIVLVIMALGMHHKEWLSHPIEHILALPQAGAYGIGPIHPLVFSLIGYLLVYPFRRLFRRKPKES
jgi:hypothetical protein